ncbi:Histone H3.2, partial [Melipona quadrifasciata]
EIRKYRWYVELLTRKLPFQRFTREIVEDLKAALGSQSGVVISVVYSPRDLFEDTNLRTNHRAQNIDVLEKFELFAKF